VFLIIVYRAGSMLSHRTSLSSHLLRRSTDCWVFSVELTAQISREDCIANLDHFFCAIYSNSNDELCHERLQAITVRGPRAYRLIAYDIASDFLEVHDICAD
jgi:hypothetical protein